MFLGPWVSILAVVSAYAFLGPEWSYLPRWSIWGIGLLIGALMGLVYTVVAAVADVALLAVKLSALPNGKRAWLSGLVPPAAFMLSYLVIKPWNYWKGGPWSVAAALLLPPIVAALASRIALRQAVR
jgi:hypothetical protein